MVRFRCKLRLAGAAGMTALALAAVGCSSTAASPASGGGSSAGTPVKGGTATVALPAGVTYNWIFPFYAITNASVYNDNQFQFLMYRPLYMFGNNTNDNVAINYPLSPASPPVYSNGGKTVVVNMKGWKWSNGEAVDAKSLLFYMNMAEAEKANWAAYSTGLLPDNVTSYKATGPNQVTFNLNKAYSSLWFTYNQLAELTPMPPSWDVTSLTGKPGSGGCITDSKADGWARCKKVYTFLTAQSKQAATYATSPLWSVVDGPWKLSAFSTTGNVTMVPNKAYSGSPKPEISAVKFVPYTDDSTEYTALKTGQLDVGNIPSQDLPPKSANSVLPATNPLGSGYTLQPFYSFGIYYAQPNFNNPQVGPMVRQLYMRQALQSVFDQNGIDKAIYRGYAIPNSGPAPNQPPGNQWQPGRAAAEQQPGPVPVQHRQGQVTADQSRLGHAGRRDGLPGPVEVRDRHHQGPAGQVHLRLSHRSRLDHRPVAGLQVGRQQGGHRHQPGRADLQHHHRRGQPVRADGPEVQRPGVRLRRLGLRRPGLRADRRAAVRHRGGLQLG